MLLVVLDFAFRATIFIISLFTLSCPLSLYSSVPLFTEIQRTRIRSQISMRVLPSTADGDERDWLRSWVPFVDSLRSQGDYYLQSQEHTLAKSEIVVLFLAERYDKGMRAKQATAPLGAVRHKFLKEGLSTDFLESKIVVAAREGCKLRSADLRTKAESNGDKSALPTPEGVFERMRLTHWCGMNWESGSHMTSKSAYLANMLAFDVIGGRVKQYTMKTPKGEDHCIKCQDLVFVAVPSGETEASTTTRVGLKIDANFPNVDSRRILACDFRQVSAKGKAIHDVKTIGRRTFAESQFLDDMIEWCQRSGVRHGDDLFTRYSTAANGIVSRRSLQSKDVAKAKAEVVSSLGLDHRFALTHGSRKGGISQMNSCGSSRVDRLTRANHSERSSVSENVYIFKMTGVGALGLSDSVDDNKKLSIEDCRRIGNVFSGSSGTA